MAAIKDCRATLNFVFTLASTDLAANRIISRMFSSFEKDCLSRKIKPPEWNLPLFLRNLTCLPYETLKLSSDKHLPRKSCFLLAVTSAKRISELYDFSHRVRHLNG